MRGLNTLRAVRRILCFRCNLSHLLAGLGSANLPVHPITLHASDQIKLIKYKNFKKRLMVSGKERVPMPQCYR
jgi:hypothetical protein